MIAIAVAGAAGRMGREIVRVVAASPGARLSGALEAAGHEAVGRDAGEVAGLPDGRRLDVAITDDPAAAFAGAAVVIAFTTAPGATPVAHAAAGAGAALVLGTTGLSPADRASIDLLAARIPVLVASNMSVGVNVLLRAVEKIARHLAAYDVAIEETHHVHKKDAPSGTALSLAEAVARGRGRPVPRESIVSRREGEVVGDHVVAWTGNGERIEVRHHAESRALFAHGAVRAALWIAGRAPGLHTMQDAIGMPRR